MRKQGYNLISVRNQRHFKFWRYSQVQYPQVMMSTPQPKQDYRLQQFTSGISLRLGSIPTRSAKGKSRISCAVYFAGKIAAVVYDQIKSKHQLEIEDGLFAYEVDWRKANTDRQVRIYQEGCTLNDDEFDSCAKWMIMEALPLMQRVVVPLAVRYHRAIKLETNKAA